MKISASHTTLFFLSLITPLVAQDFTGTKEISATSESQDALPVFASQDASTLDTHLPIRRDVESVVDLTALREPSAYQESSGNQEIASVWLKNRLAVISATYRETGKAEVAADCQDIALSVEQRAKMDPSKILETVEIEVAANPTCACEIVKTAIKATDAGVSEVLAIVEASIHAAPETMRIVSQCAIAAAPESVSAVQALLAKLDPNAGDSAPSAKSAKDAKSVVGPVEDVASAGNPLDFPGGGPVGPTPGGPGGTPEIPVVPPIVIIPPMTLVDP